MLCDSLFDPYLLFIPPSSSPLDPETIADAAEFDYIVDDPSLLEQPGKAPPLDRQISFYCLH